MRILATVDFPTHGKVMYKETDILAMEPTLEDYYMFSGGSENREEY